MERLFEAHACSSGYRKDSQEEQALGRSKGGFSIKIHAMVDALGNPLKFILTSGQKNDITQANSLIEAIENTMVIVDKAYDSNAFIQTLEEKKCIPVIPSRKSRKKVREYENIYIKSGI